MKNNISVITEQYKKDYISEKLVKVIFKSCGYEYSYGDKVLYFEKRKNLDYIQVQIKLPITLEKVMYTIITAEKSEAYRIGKMDKQDEMKRALGL